MSKSKNKSKINPFKEAVDKIEEEIKEPKKEEIEVKEDRSDYNCTECGGDGLVKKGLRDIICPVCSGTGKI